MYDGAAGLARKQQLLDSLRVVVDPLSQSKYVLRSMYYISYVQSTLYVQAHLMCTWYRSTRGHSTAVHVQQYKYKSALLLIIILFFILMDLRSVV